MKAKPRQYTRDEVLQAMSIKSAHKKEHCWISVLTLQLDDEACRKLATQDPRNDAVTLDGTTRMVSIDVACINCEMNFRPGLVGTVCLGDAVIRKDV